MKTYEGLFIFPELLKDDAVDVVMGRVRSEIEKLNGSVQSSVLLGKRMFSRPLGKRDAGLYARVCFSLEPDKIGALQARFKLVENLFRVQIVRADPSVPSAPPAVEAAGEQKIAGSPAGEPVKAAAEVKPDGVA